MTGVGGPEVAGRDAATSADTVTAGWRPDPERAGHERWWDGMEWAEFRRIAPSALGRRITSRAPTITRYDDATGFHSIIVGSPVWVGGLYWFVSMGSAPLLVRMQPLERPLVKLGFFVLVTLALVMFAALDRRALRAHGFGSTPSPLWAFATPIAYLLARARVVDGADRVPLVIHLGLLAVSVLGVLLGVALGIQHLAM